MADHNASSKKKKGFFSGISKFFRDVFSEVKKITWPSRKQVVNNTIIVIIAIIIIGAVIAGFDAVLGWIVNHLFNRPV